MVIEALGITDEVTWGREHRMRRGPRLNPNFNGQVGKDQLAMDTKRE